MVLQGVETRSGVKWVILASRVEKNVKKYQKNVKKLNQNVTNCSTNIFSRIFFSTLMFKENSKAWRAVATFFPPTLFSAPASSRVFYLCIIYSSKCWALDQAFLARFRQQFWVLKIYFGQSRPMPSCFIKYFWYLSQYIENIQFSEV